jgi:N-methylhydantoinase B
MIVKGGQPGGRSRSFITVNGKTFSLPGKVTMRIAKDTAITHEQTRGSGYGDPRKRHPALVREHIADGKTSAAFARGHYGA